ncbi:MAG: hypothetical protein ABW128_21270 [Rhizorhabdus sp.]
MARQINSGYRFGKRPAVEDPAMTASKLALIFLSLAIPMAAQAKIPMLNATCPGNLEIHADEGGPIYVNGREAKLRAVNANYYEATLNRVTISVSINPDGTPEVSYTGPRRANGVCQVKGN